jgi:CAAX protease family protein
MAILDSRRWTIVGLLIALFGIPVIISGYYVLAPDPKASEWIVVRELVILALTAVLMWVVVSGERKPLSSIGLRFDGLGRSLAWGVGLAIAAFAGLVICLGIYGVLGIHYGEGAAISRALPVTLLTVVRAGISEELFYRGYAIERLQSLTGSRWIAGLVPLVMFAGFHYRQGVPGMVLALVIGAIFTAFYLWKRNLVAAIIAHFLVDFVPNVLVPLVSGGNS